MTKKRPQWQGLRARCGGSHAAAAARALLVWGHRGIIQAGARSSPRAFSGADAFHPALPGEAGLELEFEGPRGGGERAGIASDGEEPGEGASNRGARRRANSLDAGAGLAPRRQRTAPARVLSSWLAIEGEGDSLPGVSSPDSPFGRAASAFADTYAWSRSRPGARKPNSAVVPEPRWFDPPQTLRPPPWCVGLVEASDATGAWRVTRPLADTAAAPDGVLPKASRLWQLCGAYQLDAARSDSMESWLKAAGWSLALRRCARGMAPALRVSVHNAPPLAHVSFELRTALGSGTERFPIVVAPQRDVAPQRLPSRGSGDGEAMRAASDADADAASTASRSFFAEGCERLRSNFFDLAGEALDLSTCFGSALSSISLDCFASDPALGSDDEAEAHEAENTAASSRHRATLLAAAAEAEALGWPRRGDPFGIGHVYREGQRDRMYGGTTRHHCVWVDLPGDNSHSGPYLLMHTQILRNGRVVNDRYRADGPPVAHLGGRQLLVMEKEMLEADGSLVCRVRRVFERVESPPEPGSGMASHGAGARRCGTAGTPRRQRGASA